MIELVETQFAAHPGSVAAFGWPVTRAQALQVLQSFIDERLEHFGRWQDAMWAGEPWLYHAHISAALNLKLLNPREVISAAEAAYRTGRAPLPGRRNVVVTRNPAFEAAGAECVPSLDAALQRLADAPRVFVIGGAQLYAAALPLAQRLLLTEVDADLLGDAFFPSWDRKQFAEVARQSACTAAGTPYHFVTYERRP